MTFILSFGDIIVNFLGVLIMFVVMYILSLSSARKSNDNTEYTKNIKLNRHRRILLGFFFYKLDKVEMEAVINQIANYILTTIFLVASVYIDLHPKIVGICYMVVFFCVIGGCLIYRFKKSDFKDSKDHYE